MALIIQTPDAAYSVQTVSLNAQDVNLTFRWNTIADAWSMDVVLGDTILRQGITFKSDRDFTSHYIDMTKRLGGFFYCQRNSDDKLTPLNRNSFSSGIETHRILFIQT